MFFIKFRKIKKNIVYIRIIQYTGLPAKNENSEFRRRLYAIYFSILITSSTYISIPTI